jgi:2-keto-4-pentenoate hydratase/2-oxohepta-3-ene-1,7-dioic acid hydratase in catechol pathway
LIRDGFCQERLWKEPELLVWLSSWMTLEPGDVLLTGTPSRVIDRVYFKNNDIFTCEIEGLGELSNSFILI